MVKKQYVIVVAKYGTTRFVVHLTSPFEALTLEDIDRAMRFPTRESAEAVLNALKGTDVTPLRVVEITTDYDQ